MILFSNKDYKLTVRVDESFCIYEELFWNQTVSEATLEKKWILLTSKFAGEMEDWHNSFILETTEWLNNHYTTMREQLNEQPCATDVVADLRELVDTISNISSDISCAADKLEDI